MLPGLAKFYLTVHALFIFGIYHIRIRTIRKHNRQLRKYIQKVNNEIAERQKTEEALQDSEALYESLVQNITLNIYRKDCNGNYTYVNNQFCKTFGKSLTKIIGKNDFYLLPPDIADNFREDDIKVMQTKTPFEGIKLTRIKENEEFYIQIIKTPVLNSKGNITGVQGIFWDVSEQAKATRHLTRAKEFAEAVCTAKDEFLATMSHEIRTPLNGVIGMTELLLKTSLTNQQKDYVETAKNSADALLILINDILDYSMIEAGKIDLEKIDFDLRQLTETIATTFAFQAQEKGIEILCDIHYTVPKIVKGDPGRLQQILFNLVGNALKFTEKSEIIVRVRVKETHQENVILCFSISDTGIGISKEHRERIFQSFSQVDSTATRKYGGTGLGLAISSKLIKLMQGKFWLDSIPGKGSTFHFTAGFEISNQSGITQINEMTFDGSRVLIIDDNQTNCVILKECVSGWGFQPTMVHSGKEAIEFLKRQAFDLILMDIQMPEMDGIQATRTIRNSQTNEFDPHIPIIALTANAMKTDRDNCFFAGMDGFLAKPLNLKYFTKIINDFSSKKLKNEIQELN